MSKIPGGAAMEQSAANAVARAKSALNGVGARLKSAEPTPTEAIFSDAQGVEGAAEARPATERAEETLDRVGERLGVFAAEASLWVRKSTALAREEAEDIWADAQHLRRNGTS